MTVDFKQIYARYKCSISETISQIYKQQFGNNQTNGSYSRVFDILE